MKNTARPPYNVHPDDGDIWIPVLVPMVEPDGSWTVRCPDCGRPNNHGPEIGFRHSHCHCEGMRVRRAFDGYVLAPPSAWLAPYPDACHRCPSLKIYSPIDLEEDKDGDVLAIYSCDRMHEWTCHWGDRARPPRPAFRAGVRTALYRHYDASGVLLYVGITNDLVARGKSHSRDSQWVAYAVRAEAVWFDSRAEAEHEERRAIQTESPVFNSAHALTPLADRVSAYFASRADYANSVAL